MKFALVILALVAAASAQFNTGAYNNANFNRYNPNLYRPTPAPFRKYSPVSVTPTYAPLNFVSSTAAPVRQLAAIPVSRTSDERNAETLKSGNEINPDGSFNYFFETNNGIAAQEQGVPRDFGGNPPVVPVVTQGGFSWISPEGETIAITYVADENGYQPSGNAIPTPPPIPAQIARALEYLARNAPSKK